MYYKRLKCKQKEKKKSLIKSINSKQNKNLNFYNKDKIFRTKSMKKLKRKQWIKYNKKKRIHKNNHFNLSKYINDKFNDDLLYSSIFM